MEIVNRCAVMISAAALFAGCGGSQPPIGASGAMPQSRLFAQHEDHGSWMLPNAGTQDLLYIANTGGGVHGNPGSYDAVEGH